MKDSPKTGLARAISKLGFCSRARAAELIRGSKVRLNGALRRDPETPVRLAEDRIEVEGQVLRAAAKIYLAMNKPRGVVTTVSDEKGRETVYKYLPADAPWCSPVGRLDQASEGLLLFANDTEWANRVTDPETHLEKTYHVQIGIVGDERLLEVLQRGIQDGDGELLRAKRAAILRSGERNSWLEIVLDEGKNRQIRRLLEAQNIEVLRLIRVAIGPLRLGELAKGAVRTLTREEKLALDREMMRSAKKRKAGSGRKDSAM
jgi:23S rRNA pseudouridine2605 synthase